MEKGLSPDELSDILIPLTGAALENYNKLLKAAMELGAPTFKEKKIPIAVDSDPGTARIRSIGDVQLIVLNYQTEGEEGRSYPHFCFTCKDGKLVFSPLNIVRRKPDMEKETADIIRVLSSLKVISDETVNCEILRHCLRTASLCSTLVEYGFDEYVKTGFIVAPDQEVNPNTDIPLDDDLIQRVVRLKACAMNDNDITEPIKLRINIKGVYSTYYVAHKEIDGSSRFLLAREEDLNQVVIFTFTDDKITELYGDKDLLMMILRNFTVKIEAV